MKMPFCAPAFREVLAAVEGHLHAVCKIAAHGLRLTDQTRVEMAVMSTAVAAMTAGSNINMISSDSGGARYVHIMFHVGQH